MRRGYALTVYITLPCVLWATASVIILTQYSDVVGTEQFRAAHTLFAALMALILYTKQDELSGSD